MTLGSTCEAYLLDSTAQGESTQRRNGTLQAAAKHNGSPGQVNHEPAPELHAALHGPRRFDACSRPGRAPRQRPGRQRRPAGPAARPGRRAGQRVLASE